jgi:lipopolysaccharide/colanic/teichoic acid biosynthesis glycosyltransferase
LLLVVTSPIVLLGGLAGLITSRRNPLLLQVRVGQNGRTFTMLKLRTMRGCPDQDEPAPPPGEVLIEKLVNDARVTGVGRVLRRSSIDELPQLANVLAGSMSLVGPRPGLPAEVARYPVSWRRRLTARPGLTGLWQVSGRSAVSPRRMAAMDRYYIGHRSLRLDCLILLRTVGAVISRRGAW